MVVTILGDKEIIGLPMLVVDDVVHEERVENKDVKIRDDKAKEGVRDEVVTPRKSNPVPRTPLPFP